MTTRKETHAAVIRERAIRTGHDLGFSFLRLNGKRPVDIGWPCAPRPSFDASLALAADGNVGIRTGKPSGIVVLDVDDTNKVDHLDIPDTVAVETGRGYHAYYRAPHEVRVRNGKLCDGVDIKGDGGCVVYPGSVHPDTGTIYEWVPGFSPGDREIAPLPESILRRINRKEQPSLIPNNEDCSTPYGASALASEASAVRSAEPGTRNDTLNRAAFNCFQLVADRQLHGPHVADVLRQAGLDAGLDPNEVERTLESGERAGRENPRSTPETPEVNVIWTSSSTVPPEYQVGSFHLLSDEDLARAPTIISGFMNASGMGIKSSEGGGGKTTVMDYTAVQIYKGLPWFDHEIDRKYRILRIDSDQSVKRNARDRIIRLDRATDPVFVPENAEPADGPQSFAWVHDMGFRLKTSDDIRHFRGLIQYHQPDVVIIDSLTAVFSGVDLENNAKCREHVQPILEIIDEFNVWIDFIHHAGKGNKPGDWCRGASTIVDMCDIGVHVRPKRVQDKIQHVELVAKKVRDWEGDDPVLVRYTRRTDGDDAPIYLEPLDGSKLPIGVQSASGDRRRHRVPLLALGTRPGGIQRKDYLERVGHDQASSVDRESGHLKDKDLLRSEGRPWITTDAGRQELDRLDPDWLDHLADFEQTNEWPST